MNKMKNSSKKILPATVFAAILVISVFAVVTTPVGAVTQEQKNEAIEKGLEWLAAQQNSDGSWTCQMHGQYNVSATAFAVLKFEHHAKEILGIDPFNTTYEYSDEIERGWHYIFNHTVCRDIGMQPAGDPDVNLVNDMGVYFMSPGSNRPGYETGIVMMALEASCHPEFIVDASAGCVDGWTYLDVMKDTVDYVAWAQSDAPNVGRGGWRYSPNSPSSDNSVSQWPVLGLMSAAGWGVNAPDWVKSELLNHWLVYSRNSVTGCFGYTSSSSVTGSGWVGVTAAGLTELTYCGVTTDDDRWVNASRCICKNWDTSNIGNIYTMYGVMKASMTAQPEIIWWYNCSIDNHSWQEEYDEWLNGTQLSDGSWPAGGGWGDENLNTEWALLILQKVVPPPATIIEVEKEYTYTDVCFERDNDLDGEFNEDPVNFDADGNAIDDDEDGLYNEDDVDCPDGTSLGTPLPMDDGNYTVEAVVNVKNDKVKSYNPGQYYAVSTVNVLGDVETLTIKENWSDCTGISALNPAKGGGCVVIVEIRDDGEAYQIFDAKSDNVTVDANEGTATATLGAVSAGTTILMYVKFGPAQKHNTFAPDTCENTNTAWESIEDKASVSAWLELIEKE